MLGVPSRGRDEGKESPIGIEGSDGALFVPKPHGGSTPRIAITRPGGVGVLGSQLRAAGFEPVSFPLLRIVRTPADQVLDAVGLWLLKSRAGTKAGVLVLTSARSVEKLLEAFSEAVDVSVTDLRKVADLGLWFTGIEVWAVGDPTAQAARNAGLGVDLVPHRFVAEGLIEALEGRILSGVPILLPRALEGRGALPDALERLGAHVTVVSVYHSEPERKVAEHLKAAVLRGEVDALFFTAASQVRVLAEAWALSQGSAGGEQGWPTRVPVFAIGPAVACAARDAGFDLAGVADPHTFEGLVGCLSREWPRFRRHL